MKVVIQKILCVVLALWMVMYVIRGIIQLLS